MCLTSLSFEGGPGPAASMLCRAEPRGSSPAPRSQRACTAKVQKSLRYFLENSSVTAEMQSDGNAREITPMLPENVELPAQGWRTSSAPAVRWAAGHVLSTLCAVVAPAAPERLLQHRWWYRSGGCLCLES